MTEHLREVGKVPTNAVDASSIANDAGHFFSLGRPSEKRARAPTDSIYCESHGSTDKTNYNVTSLLSFQNCHPPPTLPGLSCKIPSPFPSSERKCNTAIHPSTLCLCCFMPLLEQKCVTLTRPSACPLISRCQHELWLLKSSFDNLSVASLSTQCIPPCQTTRMWVRRRRWKYERRGCSSRSRWPRGLHQLLGTRGGGE